MDRESALRFVFKGQLETGNSNRKPKSKWIENHQNSLSGVEYESNKSKPNSGNSSTGGQDTENSRKEKLQQNFITQIQTQNSLENAWLNHSGAQNSFFLPESSGTITYFQSKNAPTYISYGFPQQNINGMYKNQDLYGTCIYQQPLQASRGSTLFIYSKPKTKNIRSSMVPKSLRFTPLQLDQMKDALETHSGSQVSCNICGKLVGRDKLRSHIHECHFIDGKKIACHLCGTLLKSKGSFRVHVWRHRHRNLRRGFRPNTD